MKYRYKILIQIAILFLPFLLIIDGIIGLANRDPFHPDVLVTFGLLITGIISVFNILDFITRLKDLGWHDLNIYYKIFFLLSSNIIYT